MKTIKKICAQCNKEFDASLKEHNRGNAKYCSHTCSAIGASRSRTVSHEPNLVCAYCDKPFYRQLSHHSNSKSGLHFCCRDHKDLAQRIESGFQEIQPPHYGTEATYFHYRKAALKVYEHKCTHCDYDSVLDILEVHHIDLDHNNNTLTNLCILCPTCHQEIHFLTKTGRYHWCKLWNERESNSPRTGLLETLPLRPSGPA